MTDFAALIKRAVQRDLRGRLIEFLSRHRHLEFGRSRKLTIDEAAMILDCFDAFYIESSPLELGVAEISTLRHRLHQLTGRPESELSPDVVANTCFDALACIAALEARLCSALDRAEVRLAGWSALPGVAANDS